MNKFWLHYDVKFNNEEVHVALIIYSALSFIYTTWNTSFLLPANSQSIEISDSNRLSSKVLTSYCVRVLVAIKQAGNSHEHAQNPCGLSGLIELEGKMAEFYVTEWNFWICPRFYRRQASISTMINTFCWR